MPQKSPKYNPYGATGGPQKQEEDQDSWMIAYGDMMTLLLVFFVLMFSISKVDPVKMQQVTESMKEAMTGAKGTTPTLKEIQEEMEQSIQDLQLQEIVSVNRDMNGISLVLKGESFFPSGSATLYPYTHAFLNEVVWQIQKTPYVVQIEGHTDNIPIRTARFPSNWELSASRAAAVVSYFERKGIPRKRMRIVGFADARPVDPKLGNTTPEARAMNRRVLITFLAEFAPETADDKW